MSARLLALALFLAPGSAPAQEHVRPRVLLVCPEKEPAEGFAALLKEAGFEVEGALPGPEAVERSGRFELVLLAGKSRRPDRGATGLEFPVPVLGLGPYGCGYFGLLKLKNGHPYT